MIKNISKSRQEYTEAYRWLRLNGGVMRKENLIAPENEYEDCAILSYDYQDSDFDGWINHARMSQFIKRFHKWCYEKGEIPF